jgi:ABC-type proline/glycine betaine transport system permease subunit
MNSLGTIVTMGMHTYRLDIVLSCILITPLLSVCKYQMLLYANILNDTDL